MEITTLKDLREFFAGIPEDQWTVGTLEENGRKCAIGHINHHFTGFSDDFNKTGPLLEELGISISEIVIANNGGCGIYSEPEGDSKAKHRTVAHLDMLINA